MVSPKRVFREGQVREAARETWRNLLRAWECGWREMVRSQGEDNVNDFYKNSQKRQTLSSEVV